MSRKLRNTTFRKERLLVEINRRNQNRIIDLSFVGLLRTHIIWWATNHNPSCLELKMCRIEIISQFRADVVFFDNMSRTDVAVGQMSLSDRCRCRTDVAVGQMSLSDRCRVTETKNSFYKIQQTQSQHENRV